MMQLEAGTAHAQCMTLAPQLTAATSRGVSIRLLTLAWAQSPLGPRRPPPLTWVPPQEVGRAQATE